MCCDVSRLLRTATVYLLLRGSNFTVHIRMLSAEELSNKGSDGKKNIKQKCKKLKKKMWYNGK